MFLGATVLQASLIVSVASALCPSSLGCGATFLHTFAASHSCRPCKPPAHPSPSRTQCILADDAAQPRIQPDRLVLELHVIISSNTRPGATSCTALKSRPISIHPNHDSSPSISNLTLAIASQSKMFLRPCAHQSPLSSTMRVQNIAPQRFRLCHGHHCGESRTFQLQLSRCRVSHA